MNVTFDNLQDYLAEIQSVCEQYDRQQIIVRGNVEPMEVNEGRSQVFVRSGFHDDRYFYEALLDCGDDYVPNHEGTEEAEKVVSQIQEQCQELGVQFRGGMWQRPE